MPFSSVQARARDRLAPHVFGKLRVACICASSNLAFYEGLQLKLAKLTAKTSVTHIRQCAVLIVASLYNGSLKHEGWVDAAHGWEGYIYERLVYAR
jgi:hypothetical protein